MTFATVSIADRQLYELVVAARPTTIGEVAARMEAIDALLPANDGLKWFNRLYLMVTREVGEYPPGGQWKNPAWLTRLDVVFAGFYFDAIEGYIRGQKAPSAWCALLENRYAAGVDRIQFALAGMNAHINRDLALALIQTDADLNLLPDLGSPEHTDYEAVNQILEAVMPSELTVLATDTLGVLAQDTGKVGRLLAFWNLCKAREMAWGFADHLRGLDGVVRDVALGMQDGMTGALGRAILTVV